MLSLVTFIKEMNTSGLIIYSYIYLFLMKIYEDNQEYDLDHAFCSFPGSLFLALWIIPF